MPIPVTLPDGSHSVGDTGHTGDHDLIVAALTTISEQATDASGTVDWLNVMATAYGAVGDGSTDDTAAIQAALNAAHTAGGGVVYLPKATYAVSTLTVYNNTSLLGDGPQASILSCNGTPTAVVITDTSATGCVFRDFQINVNQSSGSASHGLDLVSTSGKPVTLHRVDNVYVYYAGKDGFHVGADVIESHLMNCFAYGCQRSGFYTEVSATDNKIIGCSSAQSASHGFYILGNTTHFIGCKSYYSGFQSGTAGTSTGNWNDAEGFYLGPASGQTLSRVWLDSCEAQNNGSNGFFLDGSNGGGAQLDHITMVNCSSDGDNCKGDGGGGFKFYNVIDSKFTNLNTHIGTNPTSQQINYGLVLYSTLTSTAFINCHFEGNDGTSYIDASATGYLLDTVAAAKGLVSATTTVVTSAATAPTSGQVLTATSGTAADWATLPAAGASTVGGIELNTDLGGTSTAPNVVGLQGVAVNATAPLAAQVLTATSPSAISWQPARSELLGVPLTVGEANMPRVACTNSFTCITQSVTITYWTAALTQTAGHIITYSAGTAMTNANCTLAEIAVFACTPSTGALTSQLAITSNLHASIYASTYTGYTSAFSSTWSQVAGTTYAVAQLIVCSSGLPNVTGVVPSCLNALSGAPVLAAQYTGQTTMPSSVAAGSLSGGATGQQVMYFVMTT